MTENIVKLVLGLYYVCKLWERNKTSSKWLWWKWVSCSEVWYASPVACSHSFPLLFCFFFPAFGNVMSHINCIQRSTRKASPCESNCIKTTFSFPPIWKRVSWSSIIGKELIFLIKSTTTHKHCILDITYTESKTHATHCIIIICIYVVCP